MGIDDVLQATEATWELLLAHAGKGHQIHIDLLDADLDLVEEPERASSASLVCWPCLEANRSDATIVEIDAP